MPRRGGPTTPEGRARVSQNAIRHAILSNKPVIVGMETVEEWEEFESDIIESWAPVGRYELELARSIAFDLWRFRRCRIYESAVLSRQVEEAEAELRYPDGDIDDGEDGEHDSVADDGRPAGDEPQPEVEVDPVRLRAHQQLRVIPDERSLERILRYETHLRRSLNQAAHELEAAQARRQGQRPAVSRVDFTASPSLKRANDEAAFLRRIGRDMTYAELGYAAGKRGRRAKKK